jgi:hypothetical protein
MTKAALKDLSGSVSVHRCPTQRWGAPPIPREHGAWVMIYVSAAIGLTSVSRPSALYGLLFVVALTGIFFAQNAAGILLRGHRESGTQRWLALYALSSCAFGGALFLSPARWALACFLVPAAALFGYQVRSVWPRRKRVDRSLTAEILTTVVLVMSAPAAAIATGGTALVATLPGWALCASYFVGSTVYVKSRIASIALERGGNNATRRAVLLVHAAQLLLCAAAWRGADEPVVAGLLIAGFVPSWTRALITLARGKGLSSVRRLGMQEAVLACWFAVSAGVALRAGF